MKLPARINQVKDGYDIVGDDNFTIALHLSYDDAKIITFLLNTADPDLLPDDFTPIRTTDAPTDPQETIRTLCSALHSLLLETDQHATGNCPMLKEACLNAHRALADASRRHLPPTTPPEIEPEGHNATPWFLAFGAGVVDVFPQDNVNPIARVFVPDYKVSSALANAFFLVRAVNCHDQLVRALEEITERYDRLDRTILAERGLKYTVNGTVERAKAALEATKEKRPS